MGKTAVEQLIENHLPRYAGKDFEEIYQYQTLLVAYHDYIWDQAEPPEGRSRWKALAAARQIADARDAAHENIMQTGLKPGNIRSRRRLTLVQMAGIRKARPGYFGKDGSPPVPVQDSQGTAVVGRHNIL